MRKEWRVLLNVTIWLVILGVLLWLAVGCTLVHVPGKLTVISLLRNIDFDEAYIDPNGVMWLVKYEGNTARLEFDPVKRTISTGD